MKRCEKDEHYYENNKFTECPYCKGTHIDAPDLTGRDSRVHTREIIKKQNKTVVIWPKSGDEGESDVQAPIVGWLVVIKGEGKGKDLRIHPGQNSIGREDGARLSMNFGDDGISRKDHAFIIYDPKNNQFFIKHGDSQNMTYLNGEIVMEPKQIKANDLIQVGHTELAFIPFCSDFFQWNCEE